MSDLISCPPDETAPPSRIYSTLVGRAIQVDGACFSNPVVVTEISDEDSTLIFSNGTIHPGCGVVECGRVGLYCYESVDEPKTTLNVFQPYGFPSPTVVEADNQTRCYHNPALIRQVFQNTAYYLSPTGYVFGSHALEVSADYCGSAYRYTQCGGIAELVVIYTAGTVHDTLKYDGACYSNPVPVVQVGTADVPITGTQASFVTGCYDQECLSNTSDPTGATIYYRDYDSTAPVRVAFNNLGNGIPHYAAAPEAEDSGHGNLTEGSITATFRGTTTRIVVIGSVADNGTLDMTVVAPGYLKQVVVTHNGADTAYNIAASESRASVTVQTGDRVSVAVRSNKPNKAKLINPIPVRVSWKPVAARFRKYDTTVLPYNGTTIVRAVGFCGLSNRSGYTYYGTLPATEVTSYPNPDTFLTVQGVGSSEYRLVTCTAQGDILNTPNPAFTDYSDQVLTGPLVFNFYSGRYSQGAHGEMDVWLDTNGTFPGFFKVSDYLAIALVDAGTRYASQAGDTTRNSLAVSNELDADYNTVPGIYSSTNGYQLIIGGMVTPAVTVLVNGTIFERTGTATGLAYRIYDHADILSGGTYWQTEDEGLWLDEDGQLIDLE